MRYLIIGGSIAGLSCAKKMKELEKNSEVIILSEEERPYARITLPYVLSGEMKESDVWLQIPEGVIFLGQKKVREVLPNERKVTTEEGEEFNFDKLLIASGARAAIPDFEGNDSPSVFTVRNLFDLRGIKGKLEKASQGKIAISGAGLVSMELGDAIRKLSYKPIFLISSQKILSMILDEDGSAVLKEDLSEKGVEIHFGENIKRVKTDGAGVIVETQSRKEFEGDLLISGKGTSPNIEFLSSSGIEVERGIIVDEFLRTNKNGIFAAGDVCQGYDIVYREKRINALWPVAIEQGKHAAMNMTRFRTPYKGTMARNIITAFGNTVFTAGLSATDEFETYRKCQRRKYSKVVFKDGKLVGAIFMNVNINPGVYLIAMEKELEVSGLKDVLLSGSLSYTHFYPFVRRA